MSKPRILARRNVFESPWVHLVEKDVDLGDGRVEPYYALEHSDYLAVLAITPSGRIACVRQYRPAVESLTLELPAGMIGADESATDAAVRELDEEVGHAVTKIESLGTFYPDTGRAMNLQHVFYAEIEEEAAHPPTEAGISVEYYRIDELKKKILSGEFRHQLHISVLLMVEWRMLG